MKTIWGSRLLLTFITAILAFTVQADQSDKAWNEILNKAKGQTVYFNAWGGSDQINAYIDWAADEVNKRYGVRLQHVKVSDTADVVSRVLAEKQAGRENKGTVDLVWINGENFKSMKKNALLYGPFTNDLPSFEGIDTVEKPTTLLDFGEPVEGLEAPWGMAQLVFIYDSERLDSTPASALELLEFARKNPDGLLILCRLISLELLF